MKFLHSMRSRDWLVSALERGLGLTEHPVRFAGFSTPTAAAEFIDWLMPSLEARLSLLGASWTSLPEQTRQVLMMGLGAVSGGIPMLCFTEIPQGRDLRNHHFLFGAYGLCVRREWLLRNGGDRVIYVGDGSPVSLKLHRLTALLQIGGLTKGPAGEVWFSNDSTRAVLDLLAHVEIRANMEELEWRIAGRHGFFGGPRDLGVRIPIGVSDIESVLVMNDFDASVVSTVLANRPDAREGLPLPSILVQPQSL